MFAFGSPQHLRVAPTKIKNFRSVRLPLQNELSTCTCRERSRPFPTKKRSAGLPQRDAFRTFFGLCRRNLHGCEKARRHKACGYKNKARSVRLPQRSPVSRRKNFFTGFTGLNEIRKFTVGAIHPPAPRLRRTGELPLQTRMNTIPPLIPALCSGGQAQRLYRNG